MTQDGGGGDPYLPQRVDRLAGVDVRPRLQQTRLDPAQLLQVKRQLLTVVRALGPRLGRPTRTSGSER